MDSTQILLKRLSSPRDISNQLDLVLEMFRDDTERILWRKGFFSESFDEAYQAASRILKNTLIKEHLDGVSRFRSYGPERALRWILARLCNSVKNVLTNENDLNFIPKKNELVDNIFSEFNDFEKIEILMDIQNLGKYEIERGLRLVWSQALTDSDFDWLDFADLCQQYGFDAEDLSNSKSKAELDSAGFAQLVLNFEGDL